MQEILEKSLKVFTEGSIVTGKIIQKRKGEVLVDIGYKSEGIIPLNEFDQPDSVQVGDEVEVLLERLEDDEGNCILSKEKAALKQNWEKIVKIFNDGGTIEVRQAEVDNDEIDRSQGDGAQTGFGIFRIQHDELFQLESGTKKAPDLHSVVDDQDHRRSASHRTPSSVRRQRWTGPVDRRTRSCRC